MKYGVESIHLIFCCHLSYSISHSLYIRFRQNPNWPKPPWTSKFHRMPSGLCQSCWCFPHRFDFCVSEHLPQLGFPTCSCLLWMLSQEKLHLCISSQSHSLFSENSRCEV